MNHLPEGRLSLEQLSVISGAQREWCEQRSIDPEGGRGLDVARAMTAMYRNGMIWQHELVAYRPPTGVVHRT